MVEFPALTDGDVLLEPSQSRLWRNIPQGFIDDGRITSQAFRPTRKDDRRLSVAQESVVSAADHYRQMTADFGIQSVGVWAVMVEEAIATGARVVDDRSGEDPPDPCPIGHAYVDFRDCTTNSRVAKRAGQLRDRAVDRGPVFAPTGSS